MAEHDDQTLSADEVVEELEKIKAEFFEKFSDSDISLVFPDDESIPEKWRGKALDEVFDELLDLAKDKAAPRSQIRKHLKD